MRLIDAIELVRKANKLDVFYFTGETDIQIHDCQMVELGAVLAEIDEAPTVDAVEVVHAYWKGYEPGDWHCSHCGEYAADGGYEQTKYCPNCGAKMDGDGNA